MIQHGIMFKGILFCIGLKRKSQPNGGGQGSKASPKDFYI